MSTQAIPPQAHKTGEKLHGFVIQDVTELPDVNARAYSAVHEATGAQLLHIHSEDEENMFSIGLRTPPPDSTGVAHILEHCVLAGSKKFPVKDAFAELDKRTLNTFLNAMTWPDRTVYPTCSAVKADYFNLAEVYADLVFNPLLKEKTFKQEGHHLEFAEMENTESPLTVTGVVYNEMKGAYSSPEQVVFRNMQQLLLPEGVYGRDSGGDPEIIPELTYEDFVSFHHKYYSPSNARIMLYGNISTEENLAFLEKVLAPFDRTEVHSEIPPHPRWTEPRAAESEYPVGSTDTLEDKTFVTVAWMANEVNDAETTLELEILGEALTGSAASPVRKALIDSGLGQDLFPGECYDADIREALFVFGLRGTNPDKAEEIETLILDTLRDLADNGLPADLIEASLHQIEFHGKEIRPPFPLMLLFRANPQWYFGGDPKAGLQFSDVIEAIRQKYASNPNMFSKLIRTWLVDNPHRLRLVTKPSNDLASRQETAFSDRMAKLKATLSEGELIAIRTAAGDLKAAQEQPDAPEAVATLPKLKLEDIPRQARTIPSVPRKEGGVPINEHEVFSNGIGYVGLSFDIADIAEEDAVYLPLLGSATRKMGAAGLGYEQMATRIANHTGGLKTSMDAGRELGGGAYFQRLNLDAKALARNAGDLADILGDVLVEPDPSNQRRLRDLISESASHMQARLLPMGHLVACMAASAALGPQHYRREQWDGATQVRFLNKLVKSAEAEAGAIAERIARLQKQIFCKSRLIVDIAGDAAVLEALRPAISRLLDRLPEGSPATAGVPNVPPSVGNTGIVISAQVNYVAQALEMPDFKDPAAAKLQLLTKLISNDFLYQKLRVQGGAYGGFSFYTPQSGVLPLASYRDPHLTETIEVYGQIADWLKGSLTDAAVDDCRIGAIGSFDRILSPAQKLEASRGRSFLGLSDEVRGNFRDGLMTASADEIRKAAVPLFEAAVKTAPIAVLGSRENLEKANEKLETKLTLVELE